MGGPIFILTYVETEFLLAEAKIRAWNVPETAKMHYANGLTTSKQSLSQFDPLANINANQISSFVNQNPLDDTSNENAYNNINTRIG